MKCRILRHFIWVFAVYHSAAPRRLIRAFFQEELGRGVQLFQGGGVKMIISIFHGAGVRTPYSPSGSVHGHYFSIGTSAERFSRDKAQNTPFWIRAWFWLRLWKLCREVYSRRGQIAYSVSSSKGIPSQYIPHFYYPSFEVIKLVSCSAQLSMEFIMLINVEMSTNSSHFNIY